MAHSYLLRGGRVLTQKADKIAVNIAFTFFVWDKSAKRVAFCFYAPPFDEKSEKRMTKAFLSGTDAFQTVGIGRSLDRLTSFAKAIDLKKLTDANASLSIAKVGESESNMTATIKVDVGPVLLPFSIVATLPSYFPMNSRGYLFGKIQKSRGTPSLEDLDKSTDTEDESARTEP